MQFCWKWALIKSGYQLTAKTRGAQANASPCAEQSSIEWRHMEAQCGRHPGTAHVLYRQDPAARLHQQNPIHPAIRDRPNPVTIKSDARGRGGQISQTDLSVTLHLTAVPEPGTHSK